MATMPNKRIIDLIADIDVLSELDDSGWEIKARETQTLKIKLLEAIREGQNLKGIFMTIIRNDECQCIPLEKLCRNNKISILTQEIRIKMPIKILDGDRVRFIHYRGGGIKIREYQVSLSIKD
jgi:hypothetical protein